jgi:hypothetical protein
VRVHESRLAVDRIRDGPGYFDACGRWYRTLTPAQQETVGDVISFNDRPELLLPLLADLPAAPKFPTEAAERWPKRLVGFGFPRRPGAISKQRVPKKRG